LENDFKKEDLKHLFTEREIAELKDKRDKTAIELKSHYNGIKGALASIVLILPVLIERLDKDYKENKT